MYRLGYYPLGLEGNLPVSPAKSKRLSHLSLTPPLSLGQVHPGELSLVTGRANGVTGDRDIK